MTKVIYTQIRQFFGSLQSNIKTMPVNDYTGMGSIGLKIQETIRDFCSNSIMTSMYVVGVEQNNESYKYTIRILANNDTEDFVVYVNAKTLSCTLNTTECQENLTEHAIHRYITQLLKDINEKPSDSLYEELISQIENRFDGRVTIIYESGSNCYQIQAEGLDDFTHYLPPIEPVTKYNELTIAQQLIYDALTKELAKYKRPLSEAVLEKALIEVRDNWSGPIEFTLDRKEQHLRVVAWGVPMFYYDVKRYLETPAQYVKTEEPAQLGETTALNDEPPCITNFYNIKHMNLQELAETLIVPIITQDKEGYPHTKYILLNGNACNSMMDAIKKNLEWLNDAAI